MVVYVVRLMNVQREVSMVQKLPDDKQGRHQVFHAPNAPDVILEGKKKEGDFEDPFPRYILFRYRRHISYHVPVSGGNVASIRNV